MGNLTDDQIKAIENELEELDSKHSRYSSEIKFYRMFVKEINTTFGDIWTCSKFPGELYGDTFMDNGCLQEWFKRLGIAESEYEITDD
jgi:hypothetical protein